MQATKKLEIYKLGPYLILSLNRFKQQNVQLKSKIDDLVRFPVTNFNLNDHVIWKGKPHTGMQDMIYDLQGVIKHYGGMSNGHYTDRKSNV